jgi:hypothetical protein
VFIISLQRKKIGGVSEKDEEPSAELGVTDQVDIADGISNRTKRRRKARRQKKQTFLFRLSLGSFAFFVSVC